MTLLHRSSGRLISRLYLLSLILATPVPDSYAADPIPTGSLEFKNPSGKPLTCRYEMDNRDLPYNNDREIYCEMQNPTYLELHDAPSALTLRFVQYEGAAGQCWSSSPKLAITMKTRKSHTTTGLLDINDILRSATNDKVVVPGLQVISAQRSTAVGPEYNYKDNLSCITIRRSD